MLLRMSKLAVFEPTTRELLPLMTTLLCDANVGLTATLSRMVYG